MSATSSIQPHGGFVLLFLLLAPQLPKALL